MLAAALGCLDVELVEATNGEEGVAAAREADFDLILMDVYMPVMNGVDATRAIRALGGSRSQTAIVGFTVDVRPEQMSRYEEVGMNDVIAKPVDPAELIRKVFYWSSVSGDDDTAYI
jgi:CheY-like chemotaxis protein